MPYLVDLTQIHHQDRNNQLRNPYMSEKHRHNTPPTVFFSENKQEAYNDHHHPRNGVGFTNVRGGDDDEEIGGHCNSKSTGNTYPLVNFKRS